MRRHIGWALVSVVSLGFSGLGGAMAADMAVKARPMAVVDPSYNWAGFYAGVNAGYTWSRNSVDTATANIFGNPALGNGVIYGAASAALATFNAPVNSNGFIGGGQVGYNWKFADRWIAGLEADIQGIVGSNRSNIVFTPVKVAGGPTEFLTQSASLTNRLDYLGTVRGRLGVLVAPSLLLYGTGGLAYGGVNASTSITQFITNAPGVPNPYSSFGSFSGIRAGWTAGGGGEWMFSPNWSAKAEYLYYDLGRVTYASSNLNNFNAGGTLFTTGAPVSSTSFRGNIVRVGVNYHFNWGAPAVVAKN